MRDDSDWIDTCARQLLEAERRLQPGPMPTLAWPGLDVDAAYRVQQRLCALKQADGTRVVGLKMGLTSHAKMQQMGVRSPIHGFLCSEGAVGNGAVIDRSRLIHPRAEAEIAFVMRDALRGPGCDIASVLAATDHVALAIEVVDSRCVDFRFDLPSVIADNTSAARHVLGAPLRRLDGCDLAGLVVTLEKNGTVVEAGTGAAVLGHPAAAVAMLVDLLAAQGRALEAGSLVLSGAITAAVPVDRGDSVRVLADGMEPVSVRFA